MDRDGSEMPPPDRRPSSARTGSYTDPRNHSFSSQGSSSVQTPSTAATSISMPHIGWGQSPADGTMFGLYVNVSPSERRASDEPAKISKTTPAAYADDNFAASTLMSFGALREASDRNSLEMPKPYGEAAANGSSLPQVNNLGEYQRQLPTNAPSASSNVEHLPRLIEPQTFTTYDSHNTTRYFSSRPISIPIQDASGSQLIRIQDRAVPTLEIPTPRQATPLLFDPRIRGLPDTRAAPLLTTSTQSPNLVALSAMPRVQISVPQHDSSYGPVVEEEANVSDGSSSPTPSHETDSAQNATTAFVRSHNRRCNRGKPAPKEAHPDSYCRKDGCKHPYENGRKVTSHFFGRNKNCTKRIPVAAWIWSCRKHYQRMAYGATSENKLYEHQHDLLSRQLNAMIAKMGKVDWVIQYQASLRKAIEKYEKDGQNFPGEENDENKFIRQEVRAAHKLKHLCGTVKGHEDVFAFVDAMNGLGEQAQITKFVRVEFLPVKWGKYQKEWTGP